VVKRGKTKGERLPPLLSFWQDLFNPESRRGGGGKKSVVLDGE